ncbi:MAG TPA: protein-L-isoaspartate(D-aspartate) O-methyltransferase [Pseudogracilibacillus sp.]|nr:protein-L-isoaspartate(D-aspartate) O-methyltransferase [Pseudogracilibacillus sp.]
MQKREDIHDYFKKLARSDFITADKKDVYIDEDVPVSIGHGQTISQPTLVLDMTLELQLQAENNVLEVGTGSGYQTAMLAPFCKAVYTVERIESLHDQAQKNLEKQGFTNIYLKRGDGTEGWQEHQPYDRIMVTASVREVPDKLLNQLAPGGRMIIPVGTPFMQELQRIEKDKDGKITTSVMYHVAFVRLRGEFE